MWEKNNATWGRKENHYDTKIFKSLLDKLKTYSKCVNASTYNVTNTLADVYSNIKFQNAFWIQLTNFSEDVIELMGITIEKGKFYNLLKYFSCQELEDSIELKELMKIGHIKASNSKLFEDIINPTRKDWFCAYEPKRINQYINQPFDFLVLRYKLKDPVSRDVDTRTALIDTSYNGVYLEDSILKDPSMLDPILDGNDIGWSRGTSISNTSGNAYIEWGGDNTTSVGGESILIDFKKISEDLSYLDTINIRLRAFFYAVIGNGQIEIELATYSGGNMVKDIPNRDFYNVGGIQVQSVNVDRSITTQTSSNYDGDDLGTVVYNTINSNALITDLTHTDIVNNDVNFSGLLEVIDFDKYTWSMGTSGYTVDDVSFTDMIIDYDFKCEDILYEYQDSYNEFGYSQKNVFTSSKVWEKLLQNFHVIDIATTTHIDITNINGFEIQYPIIDIDNVRVKNKHKVLFKNQKTSKDNGIYTYDGSTFKRDLIFKNDDNLEYFSVFIKEGLVNKNKEFFLDRRENGDYPKFEDGESDELCDCKCDCLDELICDVFEFIEGDNYVLRNRASYKLLADHTFTDASYFTQYEPITNVDFSEKKSGTNSNYFIVGDEFNTLEEYIDGDLFNEGRVGLLTTDKVNKKIEIINNNLYLLRNENELVKFISFTDGTIDIFENILNLPFNSNYFQLENSTSGYFLSDNKLKNIEFSTSGIISENEIILTEKSNNFFYINGYIFYLTPNGLYLNKNNKNIKLKNIEYPTQLRVELNLGKFNISYLTDFSPNTLTINENELISLLSWNKNEDYEVKLFDKKEIDTWSIIETNGTNSLYLKNTQITNTNDITSIPKITSSNNRQYDGVDDYTDLNNNEIINKSIIDLKNSNGSFSIEFKINPTNIRVNQPVFYFGNESNLVTYKFGTTIKKIRLSPKEYITFYVDGGDDFPVFIIKSATKTIQVKSNKKINIGDETHISFIWNYTTNKASGVLYFNGINVGQVVDQQIGSNIPIDIRKFNYQKNYFGKSEFISNPIYEGFLREFRLWDRTFNSAQIITRLNKDITILNENFYTNLKGYWKLNDETSLQRNRVYDSEPLLSNNVGNGIGSGIFIGGLNNDVMLKELQSPEYIQLGNENLYILDKKKNEIITSSLDGSDIDEIWNIDYNNHVINFNGTNSLRLFAGEDIDMTTVIPNINIGDNILINIDSFYENTLNGTGGSLDVIINGTSGNTFIVENNIPNIWNTLSHNITLSGTNAINEFKIRINNFNGTEKTIFKNIVIKISRNTIPYNDIYKINLIEEKVTNIYNSIKSIDSIYLENDTQRFFFLENNNIYEIDLDDNISLVHTHINSDSIKDFTFINNISYMLSDSGILYDDTSNIYSGITNLETIYGNESTGIDKTVIYLKELDDSIKILSRDIVNTDPLEFKIKYPLEPNNKIIFNIINGTNSLVLNYELQNNIVELNGVNIDPNNEYYGFNLKNIWGIYKRDNRVIIGVRTLDNEIHLWMHDKSNNSIIRFTDIENNATLFINDKNMDMSTFISNTQEWIVLINNNEVRYYLIEHDNKLNYKSINYTLPIKSSKNITEIQFNTKKELWISLEDLNNIKYVSTLTSDDEDYNLLKNTLEYKTIEDGLLIGESGILFVDNSKNDTSGTNFILDFNNIIYKDDFNDIEVIKHNINRDLGFKVKEWSGNCWAVGELGRIIRTYNNGTNWTVLESGVYDKLTSISFINNTDGLIVGHNNIILSTFSGGDSFIKVEIPKTIGIRNWEEVLYYAIDKAIVVGESGTIIHLSRNKFTWTVDKVLNNTKLAELDIQIKEKDLSDNIELKIIKKLDSDLYRQTIRNIEYLGNKEFLLVGDNDLVCHLKLVEKLGYIEPYLNFLKTNLSVDWNNIISYNDIVTNEKKAFLLSNKEIYSLTWDKFNLNEDVNIENVNTTLFASRTDDIKTLEITNGKLIYGGDRVDICKQDLFTESTSGIFEYNDFKICLDLSDNFLPRMLFLDYYMGRKINIHLEDGNYVKPEGRLDKNILECFYFRDGESIEFSDYGTIDHQNNYLAYQDHYYINRRLLDVPNSWGKMQMPYNKYNKKITATDEYETKSIWLGDSSTNGGYSIINEAITDLNLFQNGDLREDTFTTKINIGINSNTQYVITDINTNILSKWSEDDLGNGLFNTTMKVVDNSQFNVNEYVNIENINFAFKIIDTEVLFSGDFIVLEGLQVNALSGTMSKISFSILDNMEINDVVNLVVLDNDLSKVLSEGDRLYYQLKTEAINITENVIVEEKNDSEYFIKFNNFEITFTKGSTTRDIYINSLINNNSPSLQIANQLLERRCIETSEEEFRVFEDNVTKYVTNNDMFDYIYNSDESRIYISTNSPNRLQIINTDSNILEKNIPLKSGAYYMGYSPKFKKIYVSGGNVFNHKIDVINTITDKVEIVLDLGVTGRKMIYNPLNKFMFVATNLNNYIVLNNTTIETTISLGGVSIVDHVYVDINSSIYAITNSNQIKVINNITVTNTITVVGAGTLDQISYDGGNHIYIGSSNTNIVYVYDVLTNTQVNSSFVNIIGDNGFEQFKYNNVERLYISNYDNASNTNIVIYDTNLNNIVKVLDMGFGVKHFTYNENERFIYVGGVNGEICLIDIDTEEIKTDSIPFTLPSGSVNKLVYTKDNNSIYPINTISKDLVSLISGVFIPSQIEVKLNPLITENTAIIRDINNTKNQFSIWDLWDDEMVYESNLKNKQLLITNLKYFNKDINHLQEVFKKHLISHSYDMTVNQSDYILIEGSVNNLTKYYNLESNITYSTYGTNGTNLNIDIIPVKYNEDVVYGAHYSILSFLSNLNNTLFNYDYEFDTKLMPNENFIYQPIKRTALGEFIEFRIEKNIIYVGDDYTSNIIDFKEGTFLDITNGNSYVNRVYIKEIRIEHYDKYPNKNRYVIITDKQLEDNLNLIGTINLRTRNKLGEISMDLEFTDDIMFPISNNGSNAIEQFNRRYYNNQVTSYQYARILLNDDNIRRNVTSIIHIDEDSDWILNVINWKDDPNFYYRPLDLFEVGVDKVFKKGISVDSSNYLINGERLSLVDIDFEKYNFKIVDGMTLKELEDNYYWVLNADIRNATLGQDTSGFVWYEGDWLCGTWESGTWYSGIAYNIDWVSGDVYSNKVVNNFNLISTIDDNNPNNTIWYNAKWSKGNWVNGTWVNGVWSNGFRFNGIWLGGVWKNGVWESGDFLGGEWLSGTWLSGTFSQGNSYAIWYNGIWLGGDFENGTWKNGIFDQTDRVNSRFGTKASLLNQAIWEYGYWKNGEFHSGLTLDNEGNSIASINYSNSIWKNGVWDRGTFFGGQWELGVWKNGVWENGYWKSELNVKEWRIRFGNELVIGSDIEVEFTTPHYYKNLTINNDTNDKLQNYFVVLGKPDIKQGLIHPNTESLGHNTNPKRHIIKEIIDDYTILINVEDEVFPYNSTGGEYDIDLTSSIEVFSSTCGTSGNSICSCIYECTDYSKAIIIVEDSLAIDSEILEYIGEPMIASHWRDGKFNQGIWKYGYFGNGTWTGGIWLNGVFENGIFGGE